MLSVVHLTLTAEILLTIGKVICGECKLQLLL